jgi:thiosulfate/3-mercaptopyruvate sulfurtransferase
MQADMETYIVLILKKGGSCMAEYANPEMLVLTQWVEEHKDDPGIAIVEVDVDTKAYDEGHIQGAVGWAWDSQLCDTVLRDIVPKDKFEKLLGDSGIDNNTTVVLYGDNNNWVRRLGTLAA